MSGHSRWSKIQHKKGKTDKARSSLFTKLLKSVTVAAQQGGDVNMNFSLRIAVDKAKASNVPKDNIERAIKKGSGEGKNGVVYEEGLYEGFGPGGVAIIVETLSDNSNRTVAEVKHAFSKGGSMGASGSVQWQFIQLGMIRLASEQKKGIKDWDDFQLELMDVGVEDIVEGDLGVELIMPKEQLKKVLDIFATKNIELEDSGLEWIAKDSVEIDKEITEKLENFLEKMDECEDVKEVYTNVA
jgi:YebC/PmpR family DNA-binding regulatory protein